MLQERREHLLPGAYHVPSAFDPFHKSIPGRDMKALRKATVQENDPRGVRRPLPRCDRARCDPWSHRGLLWSPKLRFSVALGYVAGSCDKEATQGDCRL